jgi:hypothetical protein
VAVRLVAVLLVDVANVVGARPDGWWRDRAGATARLLDRLALLPGSVIVGPDGVPLAATEVVAVVEGQARTVPEPPGLRLVRAARSGDDALAEYAEGFAVRPEGGALLVVTADRGLRDRLPAGAPVTGPGWLLRVLDGLDAPASA